MNPKLVLLLGRKEQSTWSLGCFVCTDMGRNFLMIEYCPIGENTIG